MPTLLSNCALLIFEAVPAPERKPLFGTLLLFWVTVVAKVGAQLARANTTFRSSSCGLTREIWMPRLFSAASRTASSTVKRRTWGGAVTFGCCSVPAAGACAEMDTRSEEHT